jgi:CheY-like chemotaxis protein/HPt (histidine-containing phosphotransfer) domain-containing protein
VALDWLPRTRVLLVEDVAANQMIVATLLRREGHMVDVAASGMAALAMVASRPYDLVFLDIFMPGIDGLETARRIRRTVGARANLPLIALTANVSASDRADYIAAGMNDLVAKPVERAALLGALARHVWAGRRGAHAVTQQEATPSRPPTEAALAAAPPSAPIDTVRLAAWRDGLPASVCATLFDECLLQLREMASPLRTAMQQHDGNAIKQQTHAMAGAAGNYGLAALEELLRMIGRQPPDRLDAEAQSLAIEAEIDRAERAVLELTQAEAM